MLVLRLDGGGGLLRLLLVRCRSRSRVGTTSSGSPVKATWCVGWPTWPKPPCEAGEPWIVVRVGSNARRAER